MAPKRRKSQFYTRSAADSPHSVMLENGINTLLSRILMGLANRSGPVNSGRQEAHGISGSAFFGRAFLREILRRFAPLPAICSFNRR